MDKIEFKVGNIDNIVNVFNIKRWIYDEYNFLISISDLAQIVNKVGYDKDKIIDEIRSRSTLKG